MAYENAYRTLASRLLTVGSSGASAAGSTGSLSAQTYAVELVSVGIVTSTGGVRYEIGETPVASAGSPLLPYNIPVQRKCGPGQKVSALSNDAVISSLTIIELTK